MDVLSPERFFNYEPIRWWLYLVRELTERGERHKEGHKKLGLKRETARFARGSRPEKGQRLIGG